MEHNETSRKSSLKENNCEETVCETDILQDTSGFPTNKMQYKWKKRRVIIWGIIVSGLIASGAATYIKREAIVNWVLSRIPSPLGACLESEAVSSILTENPKCDEASTNTIINGGEPFVVSEHLRNLPPTMNPSPEQVALGQHRVISQ